MKDYILEVQDKTKRKIHLSKERWSHIRKEHPNVDIDEIKKAVTTPIKIISRGSEDLFDYYQFFKHKRSKLKYLKVIVKYLNGKGFIITSYFVKHINLK